MRGWVILALGLAGGAAAEDWTYRDWRVQVEQVDTGEDNRVTCTITTGGDGGPSFGATISNGDVLPPAMYPPVTLWESAPRHYPTQLQQGDTVRLVFDTGALAEAVVNSGIDDDGIAYALASVEDPESRDVLAQMRQAGQIDLMRGGELILTASLNGFTAAYGKMAEQCGFPTTGVID